MNRNMMRGPGGGSNSYVSSHIRNLDTEMEMLQRKREALQYEQRRLVSEQTNIRKRPYESDQLSRSLPYYHNQSGVQNFAHLYDGGSERSFGGPQPNKKRAPINVWDNRFDVNQSSVTHRLGPYLGPSPQNTSQPMPLLGIAPKPLGRRMLDMPRRDNTFAPNTVKRTKSKLYTPPKLNSAPVQPKNKISASMMQKLPILRPSEEPSKQVNGRLGLALGFIVKKMKEEYCISHDTIDLFNSKHMQRYIRKTIRERLTSIMLNRVVGKPEEIVAAYREVYPVHTDKLILDNANVNADYDKFLKFNISRILTAKLDELFEKMQQLCDGKDVEIRKIITPLISSSSDDKKEPNKDVKLTQEFMNSLSIALIEQNLPLLLPKYTQKIISMLDLDKEITTYLEKNVKRVRGQRKNVEKSSTEDNVENKDDFDDVKVDPAETENNETNDDNPIDTIEDNLQNDETNDTETAETDKDLNQMVEEPKSTESSEKTEPAQLATPKAQQYFVKVLGQPALPNRADAYKFFSMLNAATIKKHKVIQNLLVVGFNNEEDYEKAVAASETVIGNCKLIIKANDKQAPSTTTTPFKDKVEPEKSDAVLSPDLENQITDLLTSIRETEKSSPEKTTIKQEDVNTDSIENIEQSNTEQPNTEQPNTEQSNTGQSDSIVNNDAKIKEEHAATDNETKNDNKAGEDNVYSPTKAFDDESRERQTDLETIKEVDENSTEPKTNVTNIKNTNTSTGTPIKTRQSVATPRTIRTRRSSKLEQQNN